MKAKSIFVASLLIAGAAFADSTTVETSYVLGVMPVSASGNKVILSIPWVAEGTSGDAAIAVTNLVKTADLDDGDRLTWYDTSASNYKAWVVATDAVSGVKYWEPTLVDDGVHTFAMPSDDKSLSQGQAIVLTRVDAGNTIYVVGQVSSSGTAVTTIASDNGGKWFLLAPPCASAVADFNTCATFDGYYVGDRITVDGINYFTYMNVGTNEEPSYKWTRSKYSASHEAPIPAGRGFWYQRAEGNSGALTITWSGVPTNTAE